MKHDDTLRLYQPDPVLRKRIWRRVRWRFPAFWIGLIWQMICLIPGGALTAFFASSELQGRSFDLDDLVAVLFSFMMAVLFSSVGTIIKRSVNFTKFRNETVWISNEGVLYHSYDLFKGSFGRALGADNPAGQIIRTFSYDSVDAVFMESESEYLVFCTKHGKQYLFNYFERWDHLVSEAHSVFYEKMSVTDRRPPFFSTGGEFAVVLIVMIFMILPMILGSVLSQRYLQKLPWYGKIHTEQIRDELDSIDAARDITAQSVTREQLMEHIREDFNQTDGIIYYKEVRNRDTVTFVVWTQYGKDVYWYQYQKAGDAYIWVMEMKSESMKKKDVEGKEDGTI